MAKINKAAKTGINMAGLPPSLCSPQGNWLKMGMNGGSSPKENKM